MELLIFSLTFDVGSTSRVINAGHRSPLVVSFVSYVAIVLSVGLINTFFLR